MNNQRVEYIVEKLKQGDLVEAKELIELELDDRKEIVGKKIEEAIATKLLEANGTTKNVSGVGSVTLTSSSATLSGVKSISDAVSVAPKFAEFVDGEAGKYTAKAMGDVVAVSVNNKLKFDMDFDEQSGELVFTGNFSKEDVNSFRKNGSLSA